MTKASRQKGLAGEREVRAVWESHGFTVKALEGLGDHMVGVMTVDSLGHPEWLHSEVKRCETARPWAWMTQAEAEAPPGSVPVVSFRRSRSKWYAIIALDDLARLLA
jgi:hypothetical protein